MVEGEDRSSRDRKGGKAEVVEMGIRGVEGGAGVVEKGGRGGAGLLETLRTGGEAGVVENGGAGG